MTNELLTSPWETRILETVQGGGIPSGSDFLRIASFATRSAVEVLDELCGAMKVEPQTHDDVANMFSFDNPEQRAELLRRLSSNQSQVR